jgi:hypothetical protein
VKLDVVESNQKKSLPEFCMYLSASLKRFLGKCYLSFSGKRIKYLQFNFSVK